MAVVVDGDGFVEADERLNNLRQPDFPLPTTTVTLGQARRGSPRQYRGLALFSHASRLTIAVLREPAHRGSFESFCLPVPPDLFHRYRSREELRRGAKRVSQFFGS